MSIAANSLTVLKAASQHATKPRFVHHDRGVTQQAEEWHQAVLDLGYQQIRDYKDNEVGFKGELDGVKCVDGNLFGICLPERLQNLTPDFRSGKISEEDYYLGLEARQAYLVQRIARSSSGKATVYASPSQRDSKTAECDLNPDGGGAKTRREQGKLSDGRTLLTWAQAPTDNRAEAPKLCRQQTVTIPDSWMVRFRQPLIYRSPAWRAASSKGHNDIETRHGDFKNRLFEDAGNPDARRFIGYGKHVVAIGCLIVANNCRRLRSWLAEHPTGEGLPTHQEPKSWEEYYRDYGDHAEDVSPDDGTPLRIVNDPSPLPKTGKAA